jgi:hypothetical protein
MDVNFEEPATVVWNPKPLIGDMNNGTEGGTRRFEHVSEALEFVFSGIPVDQQSTARINTAGHVYDYDELVRIRDQKAKGERVLRPDY